MPYTITLKPEATQQLAELQQMCVEAGIAAPQVVAAAFDKGIELITGTLEAN